MFNRRLIVSAASAPLIVALCAVVSAAPPPGKAVGIGSYSGEWDSANHFYPFVMFDGTAYKMYYTGSSRHQSSESAWEQRMIGLAVSKDGSSWSTEGRMLPVLEPHRYMQGDIINPDDAASEFDSIYATGPCVIRDGSLYKMWYTGWSGEVEHIGGGVENKINFRIGYATSQDGIKWTKRSGSAGANSVLGLGNRGQQDSKGVGQPFVLKEGKTYRMWYEGFDDRVWRIFYATSTDGINWIKQGIALDIGARQALDQLGTRNPVVIKRNGQYELWYQGQSVLSPTRQPGSGSAPVPQLSPQRFHILRATSPDGLTWTKAPGEVELHIDIPYGEYTSVDGIVVLPDNSCQVFFTIDGLPAAIGAPTRYSISTEVVNP